MDLEPQEEDLKWILERRTNCNQFVMFLFFARPKGKLEKIWFDVFKYNLFPS